MKPEDIQAIRHGETIQSLKPYMDNEISGMQKSVISFVLAAVNNGSLTPEIALTKWIEFISYQKLQQKLEQRIRIGQDLGAQHATDLDFEGKSRYTKAI